MRPRQNPRKGLAAARRAADSKTTNERGISVGTPPAVVNALVVGKFGTNATGAAAIQATCESQDDGHAKVKNIELGKAKAMGQAVAATKLAAQSNQAGPTPAGLLGGSGDHWATRNKSAVALEDKKRRDTESAQMANLEDKKRRDAEAARVAALEEK